MRAIVWPFTTAVTGWWFANAWSQPGIELTGSFTACTKYRVAEPDAGADSINVESQDGSGMGRPAGHGRPT